jgi:hypothetical protein
MDQDDQKMPPMDDIALAPQPVADLSQLTEGGIFLFLSIDMVNSTEFKNHEPLWPFVIHQFYVCALDEVKKVCPHWNVWKYIGDEVVFWRHVQRTDNLARLIHDTHGALQRVMQKLDEIEGKHHIHTRNLISAKATVWSAAADFVPNPLIGSHRDQKLTHPNKIIREDHIIGLDGGQQAHETVLFDFIGPEIDIGFRISKFAHRGVLLISCGLAYLLLQQSRTTDQIAKHLKIVHYERLKGVWGGRLYPIIWYTDNWNVIEERFFYDEVLEVPLFGKIAQRTFDDISGVVRILEETNHLQIADAAYDLIRS